LLSQPLTNCFDFKTVPRAQQLTKVIELLPEANPEVTEKLNEPNVGHELGLRGITRQEVEKFKNFYDWSQRREETNDSHDDSETYYFPAHNEPLEYIVETEVFEILQEDVPDDEPQAPPTLELQPTEQTPRPKRTIDNVALSPTNTDIPITKRTKVNL
jgi:hypothetical protein